MHVTCDIGYTPRKTYFTAGKSVNMDGTMGDINVISCLCVDIKTAHNQLDSQLFHVICKSTSSECIFEKNANDIHH